MPDIINSILQTMKRASYFQEVPVPPVTAPDLIDVYDIDDNNETTNHKDNQYNKVENTNKNSEHKRYPTRIRIAPVEPYYKYTNLIIDEELEYFLRKPYVYASIYGFS